MIGYVFQFIYSLYVNIEFFKKKQKNIAIGTIIAAFINILLNYILLGKMGYIVAAYTTLIGYILLAIIHYCFVKHLKCDSWYDKKFFGIISFIAIISIFVFNFLYKYFIIRYILIVIVSIIMLCLIIKNRIRIINVIKEKSLTSLLYLFLGNEEK